MKGRNIVPDELQAVKSPPDHMEHVLDIITENPERGVIRCTTVRHELCRKCQAEALRRGIHTLPLILDNGPTHTPKQLDRWLDQETQARRWQLKIQVYWLPRNASWLDRIEIGFSILQRTLLKPNDFESLQPLEKAIRSFLRYCNKTAKPVY